MIDDFLADAAAELLDAFNVAQQFYEGINGIVDANLPKEIAEIVKTHSLGATAAGLAAGWVPGAGGIAAVTASAGLVWMMYGRINSKIELPFHENIIKSVATGVATNLASYAFGTVVVSTFFSLFPVIGSIKASLIVGSACYALTVSSGYVYLKVLTKLFMSGKDPTSVRPDDFMAAVKVVVAQEDTRTVVKRAKAAYKKEKYAMSFIRAPRS